MLRPTALAAGDYAVALKPSAGYEKQLYVSTIGHNELGTYELTAVNSGVYTANTADNTALGTVPKPILGMLETDADGGSANIVVTVTGTDQNDAPLTGTITYAPPAYSSMTEKRFPKGFAKEAVVADATKLFKTVTNVSVTCQSNAIGVKLTLMAVPPADAASTVTGAYRKIGCKTVLNYDFKVPEPHPVQCGNDKSAFVKPGEIPEGRLEITAKIPTEADGLARLNGIRVTGLVKEIKEGKLDVGHTFLLGLIMTVKINTGESIEDNTLVATSLYEDCAVVLAD